MEYKAATLSQLMVYEFGQIEEALLLFLLTDTPSMALLSHEKGKESFSLNIQI